MPHQFPPATHLSCRRANSSILTRRIKSVLRFSTLLLSPSSNATLAWKEGTVGQLLDRATPTMSPYSLSFLLSQSPTRFGLARISAIRSEESAGHQRGCIQAAEIGATTDRSRIVAVASSHFAHRFRHHAYLHWCPGPRCHSSSCCCSCPLHQEEQSQAGSLCAAFRLGNERRSNCAACQTGECALGPSTCCGSRLVSIRRRCKLLLTSVTAGRCPPSPCTRVRRPSHLATARSPRFLVCQSASRHVGRKGSHARRGPEKCWNHLTCN